MNDHSPDTEPAAEMTPDEGTATTDSQPEGDGALDAARKDAARYRRRLRDTETELEKVRAVVTAHNRHTAETIAGSKMADGADLWVAGVDLDQLVDDDGTVDPARVSEAVDAVLGERPHWATPKATPGGFDGGARRHTPDPAPDRDETWAQVLQPTRTPVYTGPKPHTVKPQVGTAKGKSAGSATGKGQKPNPATNPKPPKE